MVHGLGIWPSVCTQVLLGLTCLILPLFILLVFNIDSHVNYFKCISLPLGSDCVFTVMI